LKAITDDIRTGVFGNNRLISVGITDKVTEETVKMCSDLKRDVDYFMTDSFNRIPLAQVAAALKNDICIKTGNEVQMTGQLHCMRTLEAGFICFCKKSECDIISVNSTSCTNINECDTRNGGCNHGCQDTMGSFNCFCFTGFQQTEKKCNDINECDFNSCPSSQKCINTYGSFYCIEDNVIFPPENAIPLIMSDENTTDDSTHHAIRLIGTAPGAVHVASAFNTQMIAASALFGVLLMVLLAVFISQTIKQSKTPDCDI